ncbi:MAG: MBL fold metallo-hydrolase [Verrucomicrobia bacterium]|nr:MAG: MBL fold metallo-hydrolase [Verrucomicrobiota bacterium]
MKLTDLNRDGGIGANSLLIEVGDFTFVIDAGLNPKKIGREATPDFSLLRDRNLDFVILTHCHLDHLGSLPIILRHHPETRVLTSIPNTTLAPRMLRNSVNVMMRQREEHGISEYPLFTQSEIERLVTRFLPMSFAQPRKIHLDTDEVEITFFPAGHVAGAAGVRLVHKHRAIFFTGDVLFDNQRILPGARFPRQHFDTVVTETTRGATPGIDGKSRHEEVERLLHTINNVIERGGSVLIPIFALGRMQEILTILNDARQAGHLVECPVFGGGLGMDLADYLDQIARKTGLVNFSRGTLKKLGVRPCPRRTKPGKEPAEPGIYVLSSGMMVENTPSYALAATLLGHHHNAICFVGYCDPDTPGGKLLATRSGDRFLFEALNFQCPVRAEIERFHMSGHADRRELLEFALQADPRAVVLTHGDPEARVWFAENLAAQRPDIKVVNPPPLVETSV